MNSFFFSIAILHLEFQKKTMVAIKKIRVKYIFFIFYLEKIGNFYNEFQSWKTKRYLNSLFILEYYSSSIFQSIYIYIYVCHELSSYIYESRMKIY